MPETPAQPRVLVLVKDLIFSTKITATARAAGVEARLIRDPEKLAGETGDRLIVDLNQSGTIAAAAKWREQSGRPVIGFVSHVDAATITEARRAGIDRVLARSQFVEILPRLLVGETG